ncbi:MAG: TerB family tellurite resistance protein [Bacteroidetes bacterium SW_9_63_38]|nr:MAG: TerB family tellurite resistance protein [Bacteroidetes bacterium SW_9_63_38]
MHSSEAWTTSHDLALIYIALAYGTDHDLSEDEMSTLTDALRDWTVMPNDARIQEIVMEATTAFLEGDARAEVRRSIDKLGNELSFEERRHALRDAIRIAEADGVLLEREQGLIQIVADAWSLKQMSEELIQDTSAVVQRQGENWGLIHELAFLYIIVAHSADDDLSTKEIELILDRLQDWQSTLDEDELREVFRRALQVYAEGPGNSLVEGSVGALKEALPLVQRLTVLDDLRAVAQAEGPLTDTDRELLLNLARAWDINVRLNGQS